MANTWAKSVVESRVETDEETGEKKGVVVRKVELREPKVNAAGERVDSRGNPWKDPMPVEKWKPYYKPRKRVPGTWGAKKGKLSAKDLEALIFGENGKGIVTEFERDESGAVKRPEELAAAFIDAVSKGVPEGRYARLVGYTRRELRGLVRRYRLMDEYRAALEEGYDAIAEDALEIASTPVDVEEVTETYDKDGNMTGRYVKRSDNVLSRKLAYQARVELLSKWHPEKYGQKVKVETSGDMAAAIAGARKRLSPVVVEDVEPVKHLGFGGDDGE